MLEVDERGEHLIALLIAYRVAGKERRAAVFRKGGRFKPPTSPCVPSSAEEAARLGIREIGWSLRAHYGPAGVRQMAEWVATSYPRFTIALENMWEDLGV